jgi:hypothetical protein
MYVCKDTGLVLINDSCFWQRSQLILQGRALLSQVVRVNFALHQGVYNFGAHINLRPCHHSFLGWLGGLACLRLHICDYLIPPMFLDFDI